MVLALAAVLVVPPVHADSNQSNLSKLQKRLLSGFADFELNRPDQRAAAALAGRAGVGGAARDGDVGSRPFYYPSEDDVCPQERGPEVKVNQDCQNLADADLQGRGQAQNETAIAFDPSHPERLIATFNDYRRGDGNCGGGFSLDRGRSWGSIVIPMSFTRGAPFGSGVARQYWQAGGDTSVAWDTRGNAYFMCQVFNRGAPVTSNPDQSSALLVFRSTGNAGGSWNFPGRYAYADRNPGPGQLPLADKPYLTVDNHVGSPYQDRVYATWTEFAADGTAYIWEVASSDYGETFGPRHLVSTPSPLCAVSVAPGGGQCDVNQFSQPFTAPDGTLYVVYANYNNAVGRPRGDGGAAQSGAGGEAAPVAPADNRNQMLLSRSTDGGDTFSPPVKVADYYDLPDCFTYQGQDPGRACVPEKGPTQNSYFRATNYPSGAVNPARPSQVVVAFGSYINRYSNETNGCVPTGFADNGNNLFAGVKTPGACNNKILVSVSDDDGATFTGTTTDPRTLPTANQARRQVRTDQWWQWTAFTRDGRLAVSYYDRQYGDDETTGYSDFSISGSRDLAQFGVRRVTTGSMPPPTEFGGVFWGDYTGLTALDEAYPTWSDTRNPEYVLCPGTGTPGSPPAVCTVSATNASRANDQDAFVRAIGVPSGRTGSDEETAER